jgi:uncharacterized surface anchored protein
MNNKMFVAIFALALIAIGGASATVCSPNIVVHAEDDQGNDLADVLVAPEWKLYGGWNDFYPKDGTTDADGEASECGWTALVNGAQLQVNYAEIEGYTCTRGEETRITSTKNGQNVLETVCTPNVPEVPEFGSLLAVGTLGLMGAALVVSKRN